MHLLVVVIVVGTVIGLLGRYLVHGDNARVSALPSIGCGTGGLLLGWEAFPAFDESHGFSVGRLLVAILVAATLSAIASIVHSHNASSVRYVGRPEDLEKHQHGRQL